MQITYYGSFEWGDGYGTSNLHWCKYLRREGVKISPYFTVQNVERYWVEGDPEELEFLNTPEQVHKIGLIETPPEFFDGNVSQIKIGLTMSEADRISPEWAAKCNEMDYLVLPSEWQREIFEKSNVVVPIKVIPFGTEFEYFPYKKREKKKVFTFGSMGFFMPVKPERDRKGFWKIIQAFVSEFAPDEPVRLLLKSSSPEGQYFINWKDPRINLLTEIVSREELCDIYHDMDCFVLPSRGEGVGQPPREAMATGLPVILTNYSSLTDICNPAYNYPLNDFQLVQRIDFNRQPGVWADVEVRELMYWMRYVYEHQDEAGQKGYDASKWIRDNFSWQKSAKLMKSFLETL